MRPLTVLAAAALLLAGCGDEPARLPAPSVAASRSEPTSAPAAVRLVWVPVPASTSRSVTVSGRYPQITGPALANEVLRSMVMDDSDNLQAKFGNTNGTTSVTYQGGDAFAGPHLVSVLEKAVLRTDTGGAGQQEYWVSGTWLLPDATQVKIDDLFSEPASVLGQLARKALRDGSNACVASSLDGSLSVVDWTDTDLYRDFSIGRDGLHLGFGQYAVAEGACGSAEAVIAWSALRARLTPVGREVVADVT